MVKKKKVDKKVVRVCGHCFHRPNVACLLNGGVMKGMDYCSQFKEK